MSAETSGLSHFRKSQREHVEIDPQQEVFRAYVSNLRAMCREEYCDLQLAVGISLIEEESTRRVFLESSIDKYKDLVTRGFSETVFRIRVSELGFYSLIDRVGLENKQKLIEESGDIGQIVAALTDTKYRFGNWGLEYLGRRFARMVLEGEDNPDYKSLKMQIEEIQARRRLIEQIKDSQNLE